MNTHTGILITTCSRTFEPVFLLRQNGSFLAEHFCDNPHKHIARITVTASFPRMPFLPADLFDAMHAELGSYAHGLMRGLFMHKGLPYSKPLVSRFKGNCARLHYYWVHVYDPEFVPHIRLPGDSGGLRIVRPYEIPAIKIAETLSENATPEPGVVYMLRHELALLRLVLRKMKKE